MKYYKLNSILFFVFLFFLLGNVWIWYQYRVSSASSQTATITTTSSAKNNSDSPSKVSSTEKRKEGDKDKILQRNKRTSSKKTANNSTNTSTNKKEIPTEFKLSVPFTPQAPTANWNQPYQDACEEAGILMLDAYRKGYEVSPLFAEDEIKKMVAWEKKQGWGTSISINKISQLAKHYMGNISTEIITNPTVKQIKKEVASGNPVLVVAYGKDIPNPNYSGDGPLYHILIITGYTENEFITNDPGTKRGENFKYKYEDILSVMHDWNGGQVQQGKKKVLIIK